MLFIASLLSWNHIHPVLVHFSIALLPASFASDVLGKYFDRGSLSAAAWWMLLYGAIATPITTFAGWMWAAEFPPAMSQGLPGLTVHKWLGISLAILLCAMAAWRGSIFFGSKRPSAVYLFIGALVVSALLYQGFLGGQMTIG